MIGLSLLLPLVVVALNGVWAINGLVVTTRGASLTSSRSSFIQHRSSPATTTVASSLLRSNQQHRAFWKSTRRDGSRHSLNMIPPEMMMIDMPAIMSTATTLSSSAEAVASSITSSNMLLSFTDQGSNIAGTLFQASLLPYLGFIYFLSFRANRIPALGNYGFQFVLLFVLSTIPSGLVTKSVYSASLANTDWLHGAAESLLTMANILIVSF